MTIQNYWRVKNERGVLARPFLPFDLIEFYVTQKSPFQSMPQFVTHISYKWLEYVFFYKFIKFCIHNFKK